MNEVITLITTVGFPAAVCVLLMWYVYKMQEQHTKEIKDLKNALDKNTIAVTRLVERLSGDRS